MGGLLNEGASPKVSSNRRHFNPIHTGLCHVITVYGLIQPMAGRNRVKEDKFKLRPLKILASYIV